MIEHDTIRERWVTADELADKHALYDVAYRSRSDIDAPDAEVYCFREVRRTRDHDQESAGTAPSYRAQPCVGETQAGRP